MDNHKFTSFSVHAEVKDMIIHRTGFGLGTFPIRYLGMPLSPTKWTRVHCQAPVEKVQARLHTFTNR